MKNITLITLSVSTLFWGVMILIDKAVRNANSYAELGWAGKLSSILFTGSIGSFIVILIIWPVAKYINNWIKTL